MTEAPEKINLESIETLSNEGQLRLELSPKWVRAYFPNVSIADSKRVMLLFDPKYLPVYHFPLEDVRMDLLSPTDRRTRSPSKGEATVRRLATADYNYLIQHE